MNTLTILLQQIGMFVIYIIMGIILIRTKVLTRETLEVISRFVIKLALPAMIFINTVDGVDRRTLFFILIDSCDRSIYVHWAFDPGKNIREKYFG